MLTSDAMVDRAEEILPSTPVVRVPALVTCVANVDNAELRDGVVVCARDTREVFSSAVVEMTPLPPVVLRTVRREFAVNVAACKSTLAFVFTCPTRVMAMLSSESTVLRRAAGEAVDSAATVMLMELMALLRAAAREEAEVLTAGTVVCSSVAMRLVLEVVVPATWTIDEAVAAVGYGGEKKTIWLSVFSYFFFLLLEKEA